MLAVFISARETLLGLHRFEYGTQLHPLALPDSVFTGLLVNRRWSEFEDVLSKFFTHVCSIGRCVIAALALHTSEDYDFTLLPGFRRPQSKTYIVPCLLITRRNIAVNQRGVAKWI